MDDAAALTAWLLHEESRRLSVEHLLSALAERLQARGVPLWRCSVSVLTRHPLIWLRNVSWSAEGGVTVRVRHHALSALPEYTQSPVSLIHRGSGAIRRRLGRAEERDFPVCQDLHAQGGTDYLALPLVFSDGKRSFISFVSRAEGGFSDAHVDLLTALLPALTLRLELDSAQFSLRHLLQVYLGQNAADRVLAGDFQRGTGQMLRAAVWFCDLRGFTVMGDTHHPLEVVRALDVYFECVAGAVMAQGGEVLKFIGDAQLAIFPVNNGDDRAAAERALVAAGNALAALDRVNAEGRFAGMTLEVGIALHLGDVMYGNIGGADRLDFTVIGAAVNEVCRLEALCKPLHARLVCSEALVAAAGEAGFEDRGAHALKGVATPARVFTVKA